MPTLDLPMIFLLSKAMLRTMVSAVHLLVDGDFRAVLPWSSGLGPGNLNLPEHRS